MDILKNGKKTPKMIDDKNMDVFMSALIKVFLWKMFVENAKD